MSLPSASTGQAGSRTYRVIQWATGAVGTEALTTMASLPLIRSHTGFAYGRTR